MAPNHIMIEYFEEELVTIIHVIDSGRVIPDRRFVVLHHLRFEGRLSPPLQSAYAVGVGGSAAWRPVGVAQAAGRDDGHVHLVGPATRNPGGRLLATRHRILSCSSFFGQLLDQGHVAFSNHTFVHIWAKRCQRIRLAAPLHQLPPLLDAHLRCWRALGLADDHGREAQGESWWLGAEDASSLLALRVEDQDCFRAFVFLWFCLLWLLLHFGFGLLLAGGAGVAG
mmetsp:Transcript_50920/g.121810  ORF Transcript_50920/g.121810 Transcript_50920/m.121810 type:complete len:225 (+) Transcript_50920:223-897(+)